MKNEQKHMDEGVSCPPERNRFRVPAIALLTLFWLLVSSAASAQQGPPPPDIGPAHSGTWFNAGQDGHGFSMEFGTDAQGEVTVRLEKAGRIVNGQGADTDIVIASAHAYINALNKLIQPDVREHPQLGDV